MTGLGPNTRGALFALAAFGVFATHDVAIKSLASYNVFQLIFFSMLLGTPLIVAQLIGDATPGNLRPRHPWWIASRAIVTPLAAASVFYAFTVLPLTQVYAILFATPLLITVLAIPLLGEVVRARRWAAVTVGLLGVLIVLRPGGAELELGHAAALMGAAGGAYNSVVTRKIGQEERSVVLLIYPMAGNLVVSAIALPFVYQPMPLEDLAVLAAIATLAFVALQFLVLAYKTGEAAIVAPMQYSQILWATFYGWLFFAETPDQATMIGAGVIIASGVYIVWREAGAGASKNTPVLETRSRIATPTGPRISAIMRRHAKQKAREASDEERAPREPIGPAQALAE